MQQNVHANAKLEIKDRLIQAGIHTDVIEDIPVPHPFEGVNTIYLFEKFVWTILIVW